VAKEEKPLWEKKWQETRHPSKRQLREKEIQQREELKRRLFDDKGKKK
jgi:hypothetical protein